MIYFNSPEWLELRFGLILLRSHQPKIHKKVECLGNLQLPSSLKVTEMSQIMETFG